MNRLTRTPSARASATSGARRSPSPARSQPWSDGRLRRVVGHEGALLRPQLAHERHQVVERVAFDVELGVGPVLQHRRELAHVAGADVALVGPRVHGDAVRAGLEGDARQADDARDRQRPLVAQQRDLVDVDRERGHVAARGPGRS